MYCSAFQLVCITSAWFNPAFDYIRLSWNELNFAEINFTVFQLLVGYQNKMQVCFV